MKNLLSLLFILPGMQLMAQSLTIDGIDVAITENTIFTVESDLNNQGGLENNGTLYLHGDMVSDGGYTSQSGHLVLASTDDQVLTLNDDAIADLIVDGGGQKIMPSGSLVLVGGKFNSMDGIVVVDPNAKLTLLDGAEVVGGSTLHLMYDATLGAWVEISHSINIDTTALF